MDARARFVDFDASRKGGTMVRKTNHAARWQALFEEHHSQLTEIAEILLHRVGSPEQVLRAALTKLEHDPCYEKPFGKISAVRAVAKAAIARNYESGDSRILTSSSAPISYEHSGPQPLEALLWPERAAYFLHEVLHYSRRDTALLLGISDANVDALNRFAKKRMGIPVATLHPAHTPRPSGTCAGPSGHSMAFASYE
jgi:hypothetical protein